MARLRLLRKLSEAKFKQIKPVPPSRRLPRRGRLTSLASWASAASSRHKPAGVRGPGAGRLTCPTVPGLLADAGLSRLSRSSFLGSSQLPVGTCSLHGGSNHVGHLAELQGAQALRRRRLPSQVLQEAPDECFWGTHTKASTDDARRGSHHQNEVAVTQRGSAGPCKLSGDLGLNRSSGSSVRGEHSTHDLQSHRSSRRLGNGEQRVSEFPDT